MISEKKIFRQNVRRKLNELSDIEFQNFNKAISINLFRFLNQENVIHKTIGVYAPFEKEPIWYESFDAENLLLSFPTIEDSAKNNQMVFRKSKIAELELKSDFGTNILGPNNGNQIVVPDLILMPGLAFTKTGERLGRGKGFFDCYLENFQGIKVAIGFEMQVFAKIPVEAHDMKYDWLITEKNIYKKN